MMSMVYIFIDSPNNSVNTDEDLGYKDEVSVVFVW